MLTGIPKWQSCIKYSTSKYQYKYQYLANNYKYQYQYKYQYLASKYQYKYQY